jgi:hypothetical protein
MMDDGITLCFGMSRTQYEKATAGRKETWYVCDGGRQYWISGGRPAARDAVRVWDGTGRPPRWVSVRRAVLVWLVGEVHADDVMGRELLRRHGIES